MTYEVTWHTKGRVIYDRLWDAVTISNVKETSAIIARMLDERESATALVHLVVDMTDVTKLPRSLKDVGAGLSHMKHPALGWTVVVSTSTMSRFFTSTLAQMFRLRFRAFNTLDEGIAFL